MPNLDASHYDAAMRKLNSCVHTLYSVANLLEEMLDPEDPDERADLLIIAENLLDVASYVTDRAREVGWQYTPVPEREDSDEE